MSELRVAQLIMPAADLGPGNPLPQLQPAEDPHAHIGADPSIPEEERRFLGYGRTRGCLPYTIQNNFSRQRKPRPVRVAILENEMLRATFLLDFGGRLWSLFDKSTERELVHVNPVLQPCNLAFRGAWLSGGVEWNMGVIGHSPHNCAPMFAARVRGDGGTPVLRFYEWERIRRAPYQIDAYLPDGSPVLFVRVRVINPHDEEIPAYWWSNIAVAQTPGMRVVVPAESAYRFGYVGGLSEVPIPQCEGMDVTRPEQHTNSADFFFVVRTPQRPWIAAVDAKGRGMAQMSTARLRGRKLFVWGMGPGGRRWQDFLSEPGHPYVEIQAGLARTQAGCLPMPAREEWSWLEAYGPLTADPGIVHGSDWAAAWSHLGGHLDRMVTAQALDAELERTQEMAERPPEEILHRGSGWGALERRRRRRSGERPFCGDELVFDDASVGEEERPWLALLDNGEPPYASPTVAPRAFMVQDEWRRLLENAVAGQRGAHWMAWWHLGVMQCHAGQVDAARASWERSLDIEPSAWALRNLAVLAKWEGALERAADLWLTAAKMAPDEPSLVVECGAALLDASRPQAWLDLLPGLPSQVRTAGRVRFLEAKGALMLGALKTAGQILETELVIPDLREGELSLSDLWYEMQEKRLAAAEGAAIDDALRERVRREFPPPAWLDFRMSTTKTKG
jgi:hypothetical protein